VFLYIIFTVIQNIIADNNGCKVNVDYEPPEDGLVRAEICVGVKEQKVKIYSALRWCVICDYINIFEYRLGIPTNLRFFVVFLSFSRQIPGQP
jgi:hypothetical protein